AMTDEGSVETRNGIVKASRVSHKSLILRSHDRQARQSYLFITELALKWRVSTSVSTLPAMKHRRIGIEGEGETLYSYPREARAEAVAPQKLLGGFRRKNDHVTIHNHYLAQSPSQAAIQSFSIVGKRSPKLLRVSSSVAHGGAFTGNGEHIVLPIGFRHYP
ncbi:10292_t:CDS:2, partial [Acaulospora colombiana]